MILLELDEVFSNYQGPPPLVPNPKTALTLNGVIGDKQGLTGPFPTCQEGPRTCANDPATGLPEAGWTKVITWQLQDKWSQPIASVPSYDTLTGGSPNSCLLSVFEGTPPGGAVGITGLWRHEYGICSTACPNGGTCTTNGSWNFFANGWEIDLPFTFNCNSITVGGH